MQEYVIELSRAVDAARSRLTGLTDEQNARHPRPGGWSPREIIGHLIDSAAVNHQRFVRAQFQDDLVFAPYDQDEWVRVQGYREASWEDLLHLWQGYNRHIARVMAAVPEAFRTRERSEHNFHEIAWKPVPRSVATTLDYLMADYVEHLKHHLRQIPGGIG